MNGRAPERFAIWLSQNRHTDQLGNEFRYHPRSDRHSIALCEFILADLLDVCPALKVDARAGRVVYGINERFTWAATTKRKTLDLAIGPPQDTSPASAGPVEMAKGSLSQVWVSCEAKSVMTEHGKSKPRVYDELSSSHEIVHQGRQDAIACGITVVNISKRFVSPLRQKVKGARIQTKHVQPAAALGMVQHLRGLVIRDAVGGVGFDAYSTFLVDFDNEGPATLHKTPPAPQPGDKDHYTTFLARIAAFYSARFGSERR